MFETFVIFLALQQIAQLITICVVSLIILRLFYLLDDGLFVRHLLNIKSNTEFKREITVN